MPFDDSQYNKKFYGVVNVSTEEIKRMFNRLYVELAPLIELSLKENPKARKFKFALNNKVKVRTDILFKQFSSKLKAEIEKGSLEAWTISSVKSDKMIEYLASASGLPENKIKKKYNFGERNIKAFEKFAKRKMNGKTLSDRVWNITNDTKIGLEDQVSTYIKNGESAVQISKNIKKYLVNPDPLPNNVPVGQGVYRNPMKNAMRLARTEVNMAYRQSDYDRWQKMDFVIGIRIKVSTNNNQCPMCLGLQGKYPKDFLFRGWHPQCMCVAVPINASMEDFVAMQDDEKAQPKGHVKSLPNNFKSWWNENASRFSGYKSQPMFFQGNEKYLFVK